MNPNDKHPLPDSELASALKEIERKLYDECDVYTREIVLHELVAKQLLTAAKQVQELREQLNLTERSLKQSNDAAEKLEQQAREQAEQLKVSGRELLAHISNEAEQAALIEQLVYELEYLIVYLSDESATKLASEALSLAHSKGYGKKGGE